MRLKQVLLEENEFGRGLKAIEMRNLGQVVALFGPNGAGKTRLLQCVESYVSRSMPAIGKAGKKTLADLERNVARNQARLRDLKRMAVAYEASGRSKEQLDADIRQTKETLPKRKAELDAFKKLRDQVATSYEEWLPEPPVLVKMSLRPKGLVEVDEYPLKALHESMKTAGNWERPDRFAHGVIPFLHHMAKAGFNVNNPKVDLHELEPWLGLYEEARRIIRLLMQMEFGYVVRGADAVPGLDGRAISIRELSAGQRMLLMYTVCLLKSLLKPYEDVQPQSVEGATILIDEPEVHLHPAAVIELLESMRRIVGESGQIWLGTHAVCLLPHLKNGEIWTVSAGEVTRPGAEKSNEAVELLVGSEQNVRKLLGFLQEPAKWAATRFASQCLLPPGRVGFKPGDPQLFQIAAVVHNSLAENKQVCILDCGAGTGRLGQMLREALNEAEQSTIKYLPVEPDKTCHEEIKESVGDMLADCGVLLSVEAIPTGYKGRIQIAVLCNVLHEIRPTKWRHQLSSILDKMAEDGSIVICEDRRMPVGELPHELGFLVLGPQQLQTLFSLKDKPMERVCQESEYKDRLVCVEIQKKGAEVTPGSVKRAVEDLKGELDSKIEGLRKRSEIRDPEVGREYALYSQMFVNCVYALRELG